jgi:hypothetical protein
MAVSSGQIVIDTHSGGANVCSLKSASGTTIWPTTRMVSHGAMSSVRMWSNGSPQWSQLAVGLR